MMTFEQWIELMKVLGDPYGAIHESWFKDVRDAVMDFAAAHAPRLEQPCGVVYERREENGDYTLWLSSQLPTTK
ncbi:MULTISPECIES: hypothetical protein [unclassified Rhodanobacter]|uniref:hypothetical protein n=1 Tax=unclassified Rhodanobacter TaxID=2621553 RepID=UPI001BE0CD40|nr:MULTISPECIES: hypothetical protein [unclassified Rhodanobacter]MBT2144892.1 hypothetical protein [Rhodanobacter sp. LX-99]MBT2148937.1 hypothetical protein [Rhodanobacter sp. LX-100]